MAASIAEIEQLVAADDIAGTVAFCESFELDLCHSDVPQQVSLTVYKLHMLAYMLLNQINEARFLWKRLPPEIRTDSELESIWEIGQHMWQNDSSGVQQAVRNVQWSLPILATMSNKLRQNVLEASFESIGAAYSLISAPVLAQNLGVDQSVSDELAKRAGWDINPDSGLYRPTTTLEDKQRITNLQQLQTLTDYVAHVEYEVG